MRLKLVLAGALALLALPATAQTSVPLVGCVATQQDQSVPAPREVAGIPRPPAAAASRLAYYASRDLAVLAPRGWHCLEVAETSNTTLLVTPEAIDPMRNLNPTGPAVQLTHVFGATTGRFEIARIANRIFPLARSFVKDVIDEGLEPKENFSAAPYPNVKLTPVGETEIEFTATVPNAGINLRAKANLPVRGLVALFPEDDMDLVRVEIRLPPELEDVIPEIVSAVRMSRGASARAEEPEDEEDEP